MAGRVLPWGALAAVLAVSCTTVVTPASIREAEAAPERRAATLAAWTEAVELANEFLASPFRRTLPPSSVEFGADGMALRLPQGRLPLEVHSNWYGDLVNGFGFVAQERDYGMVVGLREGGRDRSIENSLFAGEDGRPAPSHAIAEIVLHEATHVVFREGTVGFWNGLAFYLEAVFLLRAVEHSAERRPYATSHEFQFFWMWRGAGESERPALWRAFLEHAADQSRHCRHGPGPEAAPTPP